MYYYTGRLSEKSDIYSFGVLLIELLTRKKPTSYVSTEGDGLAMHFVALLAEDNLANILDPQVVEEGGREVKEAANLAISCIKLKGEERPTMRQVEMALESLQTPKDQIMDNFIAQKGNEIYISPSYISTRGRTNTETVSRHYSLEEEFMLSAKFPR
jgi:serine/threonine protein kinase